MTIVKITPQPSAYPIYINSTPTLNNVRIVPAESTSTVTTWVNRITTAGGAIPSEGTLNTMDIFVRGLESAGILSKMKSVNCFVPDSIVACVTPLIATYGRNSWANFGFITSDLNTSGLKGDGSSHLLTGVIPSTAFSSDTSAGATVVVSQGVASDATYDLAVLYNERAFEFYVEYMNTVYFSCWAQTANGRTAYSLASGTPGFFSGNRTANNDVKSYYGTGSSVYASGSSSTTDGSRPTIEVAMYGVQSSTGVKGPFSNKRFSFCAFHDGLNSSEVTSLFNLVKSMRTSLGGGSPG